MRGVDEVVGKRLVHVLTQVKFLRGDEGVVFPKQVL